MDIYIPDAIECGAGEDIYELDFSHADPYKEGGVGHLGNRYHSRIADYVYGIDGEELLDLVINQSVSQSGMEIAYDADLLEEGLWDEGLEIGLEEEYEDAV